MKNKHNNLIENDINDLKICRILQVVGMRGKVKTQAYTTSSQAAKLKI